MLADLSRFLVRENPRLDMTGPGGWTRERVRLVVRGLVAEELGDANFSDDHLLLAPPSPRWTWWLRRQTPGKGEKLDDRPDE
jgi:hypothetical protein